MGALAGNPDEPIPEGDETARLAVLDLDWEHVSAVDILAVLRSFLGKVRITHPARKGKGAIIPVEALTVCSHDACAAATSSGVPLIAAGEL